MPSLKKSSEYVLLVDNISSVTTSRDIEYGFYILMTSLVAINDERGVYRKEFEDRCGRVRNVSRSAKYRCALVEFDRSADAKYGWRKMDKFRMDGREWKVEYATRDDFKFFEWKWFEDPPSPSPSPVRERSRSVSRSRSRSLSRSMSRSPSRSPSPDTPRNNDGKRSVSRSPRL